MKRDTKKQIFSIFVLLIFMGSSIAYALSVVFQRAQPASQQSLIFDKPLAESEVSKLLENNIVVVDFYYSTNADSAAADSIITSLAQDLAGYLAVDKIDVSKYASIAEANGITQFPSFALKGTTLDTVSGTISKQELKSRICQLYAEPIAACG